MDAPYVGLLVAPKGPANRAATTGCHFYVREILAHAGFFVREAATDLSDLFGTPVAFRVLVIAGELELSQGASESVRRWVASGGALIAIGATSGLDSLLGVKRESPPAGFAVGSPTLGEGYVVAEDPNHAIVAGCRSSLHFFNGVAVEADDADVVARVLDLHRHPTDRAAIAVRRVGRGMAILIAPDLAGSVAHIQQGRYIDGDGVPAPDGTAPVSDNVLKADDGLVLDWHCDRSCSAGVPYPFFLHPVADELREVLTRSVLFAAREVGARLAMLWYYPRSLPALAHISHDSDGNDPELAERMLEIVRELELRDTWCIQKPGYPASFYGQLQAVGQEVALHFDALEQGTLSEWREGNLATQRDWLAGASPGAPIVTNKNHYTRWEGRLAFYHWCAKNGIKNDQSRGPSKVGETGYPFGTAHPHYPMEDAGERIDCLELGFQSQDFVVFGPPDIIEPLVESAARVHGIAHVIFHPAHIRKEGVEIALRRFVSACRACGMEFWTSGEIEAWERARRTARLEQWESGWNVASDLPLPGATVLCLSTEDDGGQTVRRHGFDFMAVVQDIEPAHCMALL